MTDAGEDVESALLASAMAMSDGAPTEEEEAAVTRAKKRLSLRRETVLQWLHSTTAAGGMRQRRSTVTSQALSFRSKSVLINLVSILFPNLVSLLGNHGLSTAATKYMKNVGFQNRGVPA